MLQQERQSLARCVCTQRTARLDFAPHGAQEFCVAQFVRVNAVYLYAARVCDSDARRVLVKVQIQYTK